MNQDEQRYDATVVEPWHAEASSQILLCITKHEEGRSL
jgi:hypothetical protein